MTMKWLSLNKQTLLLFFFIFGLGKMQAQTVFITSKGKKYHAAECSMLKNDKKEISLEEAKKEGYKACNYCKAKQIKKIEKQESEGKAKKQATSESK
jgi:hypothetical protein